MNKLLIILYCSVAITTCFSCNEIFEQDISGDEIHILAPADTIQNNNTVTFWWNHVAYSSFYELQIVSPDFDNINVLIADTILTNNKITLPLEEGKYEWCVRAYNSAFSTNFICNDLVVGSAFVPAPSLEFPKQDSVITSFPLTLSWIRGDADIVGDSLYLYDANDFPVEGFPLFTRQSNFHIGSLPPGTFTWTVASIDANSNISEISEENTWSFEVQ